MNWSILYYLILLQLLLIPCAAQEGEIDNFPDQKEELDSLIQVKFKTLEIISLTNKAQKQALKQFDILIHTSWKVEIVKIKSIRKDAIEYIYPFNTEIHTLSRESTSQILYADGRREVFHPLEKHENDSISISDVKRTNPKAWESIIIVGSTNDIPTELSELGNVNTRFEGDKLNTANKTLEKSALIILRKKTVNLGGGYLLITEKKFNRPYGDIPYIMVEGKVYGKGERN